MYIVSEKCDGGEVFEKLCVQKKFDEVETVDIARQVFSAIEYVHSVNIIHRDVKAENFLFSGDGQVKLIDFGLAVRLTSPNEFLTTVVGSAHYLAPEMVRQKYSKPVDVWSAGVLIYLMLFGRYPFDGVDDDAVIREIKRNKIVFPAFVSTSAAAFLREVLDRNPDDRPTAGQALKHAFLFDKDEARTEATSVRLADDYEDVWMVTEQTY